MISVCARVLGAAALLVLGCSGAAQATPIVLTYSGVVAAGTDFAGANVGDAITFKIFADNHGTGFLFQTWSWTDITGSSLQAGTYSATTSGPVSNGLGGFTTDASGHLSSLFVGTDQDGLDTAGATHFGLFMDGINPFWHDELPHQMHGNPVPGLDNATISAVAPVPAALPLLATALGGLGFIGWRRRRADLR